MIFLLFRFVFLIVKDGELSCTNGSVPDRTLGLTRGSGVQIACVEKDEFDLTQSLDASGQPDALSLPSGSNHPASGTQTKRDEKSVKSQSSGPSQGNQNKRPREEGEVSAPRGAGDGPTSGKAHAGGGKVGGDVIEIDGASEGSSDQSTPADGRAGKRMRVRGEVASSAPSQACTVTPARKAHDKTAARHEEKASQVHGADHPAQSSPATTKRQNAAEKQVAGQSGGAGSGKSPESAASHSRLSPPPVPGALEFPPIMVIYQRLLGGTLASVHSHFRLHPRSQACLHGKYELHAIPRLQRAAPASPMTRKRARLLSMPRVEAQGGGAVQAKKSQMTRPRITADSCWKTRPTQMDG